MRFQQLDIRDVRNLKSVSIPLVDGFNFFFGNNGAGKTALLEAVHLLCRGRSFRTSKVQTLIGHDANELLVRARGRDEWRGMVSLAVRKDRQGHTDLRLDGNAERRISEIARLTPLQVMLPDIAELVFGGPGERRRWLDWGTFHVKHEYLVALREYLRVLKQRNALLKTQPTPQQLAPWTEQLIELATIVTGHRQDYLMRLIPRLVGVLSRLAPELRIECEYQCGWDPTVGLEKVLGESHERELKFGVTQAGPHRADVLLCVGGAPAGSVLSRGQAKLVASALLVSQALLLSDEEKRTSIFLIDDMGAELDLLHNQSLLELLRDTGAQILATGTAVPPESFRLAELFGDLARLRSEHQRSGKGGAVADTKGIGLREEEFRMFHVKHGVVHTEQRGQTTGA